MQDTFDVAAGAIAHALGVAVIVTTPIFGPRTVEGVLSSGFQQVAAGEVRVDSRRLEVDVVRADFETESTKLEEWAGGTLEVLEGPLTGEVLHIVKAKPGNEAAFITLQLKRAG